MPIEPSNIARRLHARPALSQPPALGHWPDHGACCSRPWVPGRPRSSGIKNIAQEQPQCSSERVIDANTPSERDVHGEEFGGDIPRCGGCGEDHACGPKMRGQLLSGVRAGARCYPWRSRLRGGRGHSD